MDSKFHIPTLFAAAVVVLVSATAQAKIGEFAVVAVPQSMVYSQPSFDARVIAYLKQNQKVYVSVKIYGAFRKVVVRRGLVGFVSYVDVLTANQQLRQNQIANRAGGKNGSKAAKKRHRPKRPIGPVIDTKWVGGLLGLYSYREKIAGSTPSANLLFYGLKLSGPDVIFNGTLSDFNLAIHVGAPDYYKVGADVPPTGFIILMDAPIDFPLSTSENSMTYFGLGPLFDYSNFDVIILKQHFNMQQATLGLSTVLGYGHRVGHAMVRLEGKYIYERSSYVGLQLAVQGAF